MAQLQMSPAAGSADRLVVVGTLHCFEGRASVIASALEEQICAL